MPDGEQDIGMQNFMREFNEFRLDVISRLVAIETTMKLRGALYGAVGGVAASAITTIGVCVAYYLKTKG